MRRRYELLKPSQDMIPHSPESASGLWSSVATEGDVVLGALERGEHRGSSCKSPTGKWSDRVIAATFETEMRMPLWVWLELEREFGKEVV